MASLKSCLDTEKRLEELLIQLKESDTPEIWTGVQQNAQKLADALRVRDTPEDNHTILGRTELPQTLTLLISLGLHGATTPPTDYIAPIFEILRLGANLCMNHDENRGQLLEAGFPQAVVSLLEGYAEKIAAPPYEEPLSLNVAQLKIVRTAIGVLLNASIGYDPVRFRLISLEAAMTIIKLSAAIYPPGLWTKCTHKSPELFTICEELWTLRSGIAEWAWRTISELREGNEGSPVAFSPDILPFLIPSLQAFIPNHTDAKVSPQVESASHLDLLDSDLECLEETCMLLESLSLDIEDVRLSLARGFNFPAEHGGVPCLTVMLDFIEKGIYPALWYAPEVAWEAADLKRKERAFDFCKAAVIKTIVEVAGEEHNDDVLWDDSDLAQPGGPFVCIMVDWIKKYVHAKEQSSPSSLSDRDDLAICACLSLGNLARREKHATTLLQAPLSLAPVLTSKQLLSPNTDIKLRHAVIGLLKNVAQSATQSPVIHVELGNAGVIEAIVGSGIWDQQHDAMVEVVQVGGIGVIKHLCNASVDSAYALIHPNGQGIVGLDQLLALVKRSDSIAVKSEGTRVLVNVIKSLWSSATNTSATDSDPSNDEQRRNAMQALFTSECSTALANLVTRSGKFPLLVNEGIVALSLLSTHPIGALLVLKSLKAQSSSEISPDSTILHPSTPPVVSVIPDGADNPMSSISPAAIRPRSVTPQQTLDMIKAVLRNVDNPAKFPVEVRLNACSLLLQIGRNVSGADYAALKESLKPTLMKLAEKLGNAQGKEEMLAKSVNKVLGSWDM